MRSSLFTRFIDRIRGRDPHAAYAAWLLNYGRITEGRVIDTQKDESGVTVYTYDDESNVETVTNGPVQRTYTYDILNRRETIKDESGRTITTYHYDEEGNVTQLDDGRNLSVFFNYNRHNQQDFRMDAAGRTEERDYDEAGNLIRITDGADNFTIFAYDGRGRVVSDTNTVGRAIVEPGKAP